MKITGNYGLLFIAFWPMICAFVSYLIGRRSKKMRDYFANIAMLVELSVIVLLVVLFASNEHPPTFEWTGFMGFRIYFMLDGFRAIYVVVTSIMWLLTTILSREYFAHYRNRNRYYLFMLFTMTGTVGVFLSADLLTTFMFFEMMSFTSYVMVIHDESRMAMKAADTYMAVAVIGGLAMLMGIFLVSNTLGTTEIGAFYDAMHHFEGNKFPLYLAAVFMLVGFGGKAGVYPLHIWLPNAHPVAPAPASALLSGVLTKTGIFGIVVISALMFNADYNWGLFMLILGVLGMFTGALLALFSTNLKRTLACSSVSQIGFIMVGVGMQGVLGSHNALAVRGTVLHMINHSLIKLVLFMMAGVVYMNLHKLDLNDIRGFGRKKPILIIAFAIGVLTIIGVPGFSGYISKTLLHESVVENIWLWPDYAPGARFFQVIESIFTLTGGLTTAYMIKIFTCVCIEKNQFDQAKMDALNGKYMNKASTFALGSAAMLLIGLMGFSPYRVMIPISKWAQEFMHGHDPAHAVEFFAWINLKGAVASLSIGVIIYVLIVRRIMIVKDAEGRSIYVDWWPKSLDIEEKIYRPVLLSVLPFIGALFARAIGSIPSVVASIGYKVFSSFRKYWHGDSDSQQGAELLKKAREFNDKRVIEGPEQRQRLLQRIRALTDSRVAKPLLGEDEASPEFTKEKEHPALASRLGIKGNLLPETMPAFSDGSEELSTDAEEILPDTGGGASYEAPSTQSEPEEELSMENPVGLYEHTVYFTRIAYQKAKRALRIRDPRYGEPDAEDNKPKRMENTVIQTVFGSLAYSLLLFLIGFMVILIFILSN